MKNVKDYKGSWGTSFHSHVIKTTPQKMIDLAKKLDAQFYGGNDGSSKSNFDFEFVNKDGNYFTVYDWKEYRVLDLLNNVEFHIGGKDPKATREAYYELVTELNNL